VVTPVVFKEGGVKFLTSPAFSPDGERLAFMRHGDPKAATARDITEIWTIPVSGGAPLRLTNVKGSQWAPTWSRDGGWIAFYSEGPPSGLMKARLGSDGRAEMLHATSGYCTFCTPDWSPVDDVIAFHDADATLLISADGKSKKVLRKPALRASAWSRDGKTLYGFAEADGRQSIVALTVATGAERTVTTVSPGVRIRTVWNPTLRLSLSRDGKCLATSVGIVSGDLWQLENFQSAVPWWRQWFAFSR
jgi:Tol biopolymer transport system component